MQNPLFPSNTPDPSNIPDYLRTSSTVPGAPMQNPQPPQTNQEDRNAAVDVIRQKLAAIYADEPSAASEMAEVKQAQVPLSKHQRFMQGLQQSGQSMVEIQNAWHAYYTGLPDSEKHEVWQEFYAANQNRSVFQPQQSPQQYVPAAITHATTNKPVEAPVQATNHPSFGSQKKSAVTADLSSDSENPDNSGNNPAKNLPSVADIKHKIRSTVNANGKLSAKSHFQSLGFGLATGAVVVFIFLFGFFNQVFITPFIQPSRHANETPVIVDTASAPANGSQEVIIPKINVEIPTDFSVTSSNEADIETALDSGVVHYPTTVLPGQNGNSAFFGHSSNNIFNPGKYKFAFVLLHKLTNGDTFYLTYGGKTYTYEVISHEIVAPTDVGVLGPVQGQAATATLITCDPPGTSINRLVVVGKQINPDPGANANPAAPSPVLATTDVSTKLPGNGQSLWSRMWHSIF